MSDHPSGGGARAREDTAGQQQQHNHDYILSTLNSTLEDMVTKLLIDKPQNPVPYMIKWLCDKGGYDCPENILAATQSEGGSAKGDYQKSETQLLRERVVELERQLAQGSLTSSARQGTGVTFESRRPADVAANAEHDQTGGSDQDSDSSTDSDDEDEDGDTVEELVPLPKSYGRGPRQSVSAEAYGKWNQERAFTPPVYPKNPDQEKRIREVLEQSFMFQSLEPKEFQTVISAMQECPVEPGHRIIQQGDDGDCLYVVESGTIDCYKKFSPAEDEKLVKTCGPSDAFGELALLYNCPRAASVVARDESLLWKLDRETFNHIVKKAASRKRELYDAFLKHVPLLESMDAYERSKLADALRSEIFSANEYIVKQGDRGDKFFIVEDGNAVATKKYEEGQEAKEVMQYSPGDYFGELALLRNEPRAASVIARSTCKVAWLDRKSFTRLLGPLQDMITRNASRYG